MTAYARRREFVRLDGRTFVVLIGPEGLRSIKERKPAPRGVRDFTYWHRSHRIPGVGRGDRFGKKSIVRQVIEGAGFNPENLNESARA